MQHLQCDMSGNSIKFTRADDRHIKDVIIIYLCFKNNEIQCLYIYIYMKKCSVTSCAMQHLQCDMSGNSIKFTRAR
jgi:hypothetical protein